MPKTGFTLLELLICLAIAGVLLALGLPWGLNNLRTNLFQSDVDLVERQLIQARTNAMQNKNGVAQGLKVEPRQIITIPDNEVFVTNLILAEQSDAEIIFQPLSGRLTKTMSFTLTNNDRSQTISINPEGAIEQ